MISYLIMILRESPFKRASFEGGCVMILSEPPFHRSLSNLCERHCLRNLLDKDLALSSPPLLREYWPTVPPKSSSL